jgi:acetyl esterase/lipase
MQVKFAFFIFLIAVADIAAAADGKDPSWRQRQLAPFKYEPSIVYKTVGDEKLDLCLFQPQVRKYPQSPVMIFIHGGGWSGGEKYNILIPPHYGTLKTLLENGIACATIEYRLVKRGQRAAFECVSDCLDATRFLIKNAELYGLDPDRIGVWGASAGGHLALMTVLGRRADFPGDSDLSGIDPKFRCVVSYYPLTSFLQPELHRDGLFAKPDSFKHLIGGPLAERRREAEALSPAELLSRDCPPVLLLHGDQDKVLSLAYSTYFEKVAREKGVNVTLITVKNAAHGFSGTNLQPSMAEINRLASDFIIRHLVPDTKGDEGK